MQPVEVMEALLELAGEAGLEVRTAGASALADSEGAPTSGVCRVQDRVFVVLSRSDPVDAQIAVLGQALREHAATFIEGRFLPPAVRDRVSG